MVFYFSFFFFIYIYIFFYSDNGLLAVKGMCDRAKFLGSFGAYDTHFGLVSNFPDSINWKMLYILS